MGGVSLWRQAHRSDVSRHARTPFVFQRSAGGCELIADIPIQALPDLATATSVRAGVSAVVESEDGSLSWWALAHAGDKPDFHDPSTFVLRVAPP